MVAFNSLDYYYGCASHLSGLYLRENRTAPQGSTGRGLAPDVALASYSTARIRNFSLRASSAQSLRKASASGCLVQWRISANAHLRDCRLSLVCNLKPVAGEFPRTFFESARPSERRAHGRCAPKLSAADLGGPPHLQRQHVELDVWLNPARGLNPAAPTLGYAVGQMVWRRAMHRQPPVGSRLGP